MRTKNKKKGFQKKKNQKDAHRPFSHPTQYAIEMRIIVNTYTALLSHTKFVLTSKASVTARPCRSNLFNLFFVIA